MSPLRYGPKPKGDYRKPCKKAGRTSGGCRSTIPVSQSTAAIASVIGVLAASFGVYRWSRDLMVGVSVWLPHGMNVPGMLVFSTFKPRAPILWIIHKLAPAYKEANALKCLTDLLARRNKKTPT